jgi:hypothetical protein
MVFQLRPLVYSLGLNNPPHICLTPRKSRVKNLWRNKQGHCRCKMAGAGIQSFAKFRAQMCTAEYQGLKTVARFVAFRGKFKSGTVQSVAFRCQILPRSWHSAVYWRVVVGIPQYVWEQFAKMLFLLWQSTAFDHGTWQMTKFQHPPFYIESPPVWSIITFCRATFRV